MSVTPDTFSEKNLTKVTTYPLLGKTLTKVTSERDEIAFHIDDGEIWVLQHEPDCCETVSLVDVSGDLDDLVGLLVVAEEVQRERVITSDGEGTTWTFCKFATAKGYVTLSWRGDSNGYYTETPTLSMRVGAGLRALDVER